MYAIDRYLLRQIVIAVLFIAITLTCAIWLTQSMQFIKLILNRGLSLWTFLHLTGLLLPSFLLIVLPLSLFFSVLFTFNKMLNDREMVILRNAGISPLGIARPALVIASGILIITYFISLYLMPVSFRAFRDLQFEIRNNASAALLQPGVFRNLGDKLTVYVRARDGDQLQGILVQDNRDQQKPTTITAARGAIVAGDDGPRVVLMSGTRQEVDRTTGQTSILYFERYGFDVTWLARTEEGTWREPNERFLPGLLNPGASVGDRAHRTQLIAAGHNRLTAPLYTLSFTLVAIACLLFGQFNKRGQHRRVALAVALTGAMYGAGLGIYGMASKDTSLIPLMYVNAVVPGIFGLIAILGGQRKPRSVATVPAGSS